MGGVWVGSGSARMEVDTHTADLVRGVLDRASPEIRAALEREARGVYEAARTAWPVRTGVSRDGLRWGLVLTATEIVARVWDPVPYAMYIKSPKIRTGTGSAFVELLRKPIHDRTKALVAALRTVVR